MPSPPSAIPRSTGIALLVAMCACESAHAESRLDSTGGASRATRAARVAYEWTGRADGHPARATQPSPKKGTWVLHIGDSFVHASFQQNLRPRFEAAGTSYVVDATTATYTTTWAADPELDKWLARRPSLVLVTLGANEVDMPVPAEHARAVQHLVHKVAAAATSCVWITPPLWKKDTGILQVIHDHSAPCLFFDSDAVTGGLSDTERQRDRIHPNARGGARWTDAFWGWLEDHRDPRGGPWALVPFETR
jgi:hypothetical protein